MQKKELTLCPKRNIFSSAARIFEAVWRVVVLGLGLLVFAGSASAANWFVTPNGSGNGSSWSSSWKPSTIGWSSVQPGDTVWLAGGSYSGGISFTKSGSAGNYIYVKRATAGDTAATGAAGWSASFDAQVIFGPSGTAPLGWDSTSGAGSYVYVDGRTANGISCRYDNSANAMLGGAAWSGGGQSNIILTNLDLAGPGGASAFNYQGDNAPMNMHSSSPISYITLTHCSVHGGPNLIRSHPNGGNHHITIEYSKFYDNASANSGVHANLFYNEQGHDWTIRFNDISGWQVEGIILWNVGSGIYYIYGNIFHDNMGGSASGFWPGSDSQSGQGTVYLYNNTFSGVNITTAQSRSWQFASGSVSRNNIFWNSTWAGNSTIADSDYNFSNGSTPGANSISSGSNPFVNSGAKDYTIVSTVGAKFPKDKGTAVTVSGANLNPDGGAWDMGAYPAGAVVTPPITNNLPPTVSAITQNAVDVNPITAGMQILEGTVVQYSGSASDPNGDALTWQWIYTINGGAETIQASGSGNVTPVSFTYATGNAGKTYVWKLRVKDASLTSETQTTVTVEAPASVPAGLTFDATSGVLTAPFTVQSGYIVQASETTVTAGGRAAYTFAITNAGSYVIQAMVNAPDSGANSFFVNIDSEPADPTGIWQVPLTAGFENRIVSWQGTGTFDNPQFVPKIFTLTTGTHQIIVRGREGNTQLSRLSILKVLSPASNLRIAGP